MDVLGLVLKERVGYMEVVNIVKLFLLGIDKLTD
jgi:hypothetical protein